MEKNQTPSWLLLCLRWRQWRWIVMSIPVMSLLVSLSLISHWIMYLFFNCFLSPSCLKMFAFIKENIKKGNSKEARSPAEQQSLEWLKKQLWLYNHSITNRLPFLFALAITNRFHGIPIHLEVTVPPIILDFFIRWDRVFRQNSLSWLSSIMPSYFLLWWHLNLTMNKIYFVIYRRVNSRILDHCFWDMCQVIGLQVDSQINPLVHRQSGTAFVKQELAKTHKWIN